MITRTINHQGNIKTIFLHTLILAFSLWLPLSAKQTQYIFPLVSELPEVNTLPDPFKFFRSDRRVATQEEWAERREEMKAIVQYYEYGQGFPLPYNTIGKVTSESSWFEGKATLYEVDLSMGPDHSISASVKYMVPTAKEGG